MPLLLILLLHSLWSGPAITVWFGHVIFSALQYKITFVLFFFFSSYLFALLSTSHASSLGAFDFIFTCLNFFVWSWLLFFSNNLFSFVFLLEVLSAAVTLLLVTSTFSSAGFYSNLSYDAHEYFQASLPLTFFQTVLFFFWITLIASLALFLFILFFYLRFLTFDWNSAEFLVFFTVTVSDARTLTACAFSWFLFLFCVFLKCGIVPFFLWKPTVFKGLTLNALFFYTYVYYFSLFTFFLIVTLCYLSELFVFNLYLMLLLVVFGSLVITSVLYESLYIKAFLALSSILNSLLVLLTSLSVQSVDLLFLI